MRGDQPNGEIHFAFALAGIHVVTTSVVPATTNCKRDASARYSALQDPHPASPKFDLKFGLVPKLPLSNLGEVPKAEGVKAGGTTKRPFVLHMDEGVFYS